ncbi:MAG: hypothetical protein JWP57_4747 [Spirosoma sp.]|nr:hypothetical protein [Spirosoma sp.]
MTPFDEAEALARILTVIKNYRQQKQDPLNPMDDDLITAYLVKHLLTPDLQLWLRLEAQDNLAKLLDSATIDPDVKQLVSEFKRVAHGLVESWHQSHSLN